MSGTTHEQAVKAKLDKAFPDLTTNELIAILQFAKLVRFRARSNAALDSMCHRLFPEFDIKHVTDAKTGWKKMIVNGTETTEEGE